MTMSLYNGAPRMAASWPIPRRAMLLGSVTLALQPALGRAEIAHVQPATVPELVRALDVAAMDLFGAAEAGQWDDATRALRHVRSAATGVNGLEPAYLAAGGGTEDFIQVVNNLSADAIEAGTALSVKDQRWLVSCADRIASRAGELSRPFAGRADAVAPRIDTLLFLARRMRRALVWRDADGLVSAQDAFAQLWLKLRNELAGQQPTATDAVQQALTSLGKTPTRTQIKRLYEATEALGTATTSVVPNVQLKSP